MITNSCLAQLLVIKNTHLMVINPGIAIYVSFDDSRVKKELGNGFSQVHMSFRDSILYT